MASITLKSGDFGGDVSVIVGDTALYLPDRVIPYEDVFYRSSDRIILHSEHLELADRCYWNANIEVSLLAGKLTVNDEDLDPEKEPYMSLQADTIDLPREAMGLGDVKLMAAIGAFTGWAGVLFTLTVSSVLGAAVGLTLRQQRLAYVPYISAAAVIWIFFGTDLVTLWLGGS